MTPYDAEALHIVLAGSAADLTTPPEPTDQRDWGHRLARLSRAAVATVPGADYAALTLRRGREFEAAGPSHPDIAALDRRQVLLGEGPCLEALTAGLTVAVDDVTREDRWPRFTADALGCGIGAVLSLALAPNDASPAAVNLYSRSRGGFGPDDRAIAGAFATQAAVALYGARRITDLEYALSTRDLIGQAKGILMQRYRLGADAAFERLVDASQHANVKLADVARWLVDDLARGSVGGDPPVV